MSEALSRLPDNGLCFGYIPSVEQPEQMLEIL